MARTDDPYEQSELTADHPGRVAALVERYEAERAKDAPQAPASN